MKLHFEPAGTDNSTVQPLDTQSINLAIGLMLFDGEEVEYHPQEDGSLILEITNAVDGTRSKITDVVKSLCSWGDMKVEELQ